MQIRLAALVAAVVSIAAAMPSTAAAQAAKPPSPGPARVLAPRGEGPLDFDSLQAGMLARLEATPLISGARTAIIQSRVGDTLLVRGVRHSEFVRVPPDSIEWMLVGTGRGWTRRSIMTGALLGTAAGYLIGSMAQHWIERDEAHPRGCPLAFTSGCGTSSRLLVIGFSAGLLAGAGFGAEIGEERWRLVRLPH